VHLEPTELPLGLQLQLGSVQAVLYYEFDNYDSFQEKLRKLLDPLIGGQEPSAGPSFAWSSTIGAATQPHATGDGVVANQPTVPASNGDPAGNVPPAPADDGTAGSTPTPKKTLSPVMLVISAFVAVALIVGAIWFFTRQPDSNDTPPGDQTTSSTTVPVTNTPSAPAGDYTPPPQQPAPSTGAPGNAYVWGGVGYGKSGNGSDSFVPGIIVTMNLPDVKQATTGRSSGLAVTLDGQAWVWGRNESLKLGVGSWDTSLQVNYPVPIPGLDRVNGIAMGSDAAYVTRDDGSVWAWGKNNNCELGNGTSANSPYPVQVSGLTDVVQVAAGHDFAVALKGDGSVWVWGSYVARTQDTLSKACIPEPVADISAVSIAAGFSTGYALQSDGTLLAWGSNLHGEFGNGTAAYSATHLPEPVSITDVASIFAGYLLTFAIKRDGTLWTWGADPYMEGVLGIGTTDGSLLPVQVTGMEDALMVAAGGGTTYALDRSGNVWAWGDGNLGAFGNRHELNALVPIQVPEISNIASVSASQFCSWVVAVQG
jgi:alpha-tubulin suppressor-like RCC1 family protein